jgi:hypothetical protein
MVLEMIQGCRYLRRSTDQWILSKNSTTRQRTQGFGVKPDCIVNVSNIHYIHSGSIFIPCEARPRMDLIPNLSLSVIAYLSIHLFRSGHVIPQNPTKSAQQFPCRTEANCRPRTLLPNSSEETFLLPDGFLTELDPQVRLLTLPNFGVNICPFNYGIKVILFQNWL